MEGRGYFHALATDSAKVSVFECDYKLFNCGNFETDKVLSETDKF